MTTGDPRLAEALKFLSHGDWPVNAEARCPSARIEVARLADAVPATWWARAKASSSFSWSGRIDAISYGSWVGFEFFPRTASFGYLSEAWYEIQTGMGLESRMRTSLKEDSRQQNSGTRT